jgi:hypothetical protein
LEKREVGKGVSVKLRAWEGVLGMLA